MSAIRVFLCLAIPFAAFAADRGRLVVDSNLVLINASVTDRNGHLFRGLRRENFRLFDGKREQRVVSVSQEDGPISVGIVFDASRSMRDYLPVARRTLGSVVEVARDGDEYAAVVVRQHPDWTLRFTHDADEVLARLTPLGADGATALIDSIYLAVQRMRSAHNARKALLVISDGMDNHSRYDQTDLQRLLDESDVTIFSVAIWRAFPDEEAAAGRNLLRDLAESTGGRYLEASNPRELGEKFADLDLRFEYMIAFRAEDVSLDGRFHSVTLRVVPPRDVRRLSASWRRGYYAMK